MKIRRWHAVAVLLAGLAALPVSAGADTIAPGEMRVVEGKVMAVDVAYRTVVVDVPTAKGELTVGVTLASSVEPRVDGQTIPLSDVAVGERAMLKYTRENGSLVGLEMRVRR
jgi:hypothetical protein